MISLRFLRFSVRSFERGRECSREVFVLLLIFPRLVQIQFRNRVARDLCISGSGMSAHEFLPAWLPWYSGIDYFRNVPKGMLCRGRPSAAERLAIGSSPPCAISSCRRAMRLQEPQSIEHASGLCPRSGSAILRIIDLAQ